jgi:plastocyanin
MARKRWLYAVAAALLVFAACGDDDDDGGDAGATTTTAEPSGGAQTVTVSVDADASSSLVAFTAYFPNEVTVHPGDTVAFESHFTGEPHTVTLGSLVDEGASNADPAAEEEPEAWQKIPHLLPEGPGDAIQAAAQPCFLATEDPPASDACSADQQEQSDFDGSQTFYNSGFLADGDVFSVKLADDIAPGTYTYFCNLHRGGMTGTVTVVDADADSQTADDVDAAGQEALDAALASIQPTMDAVRAGTLPPFITEAAPGAVIAGGGSEDAPSAIPLLMGPDSVDVKVGDQVTWTILGPHTISFGASEALRTFIAKAPDGAVHLNPDSFAPAGGDGAPEGPPPEQPGPPIAIDGGSYDGNGLHSSGLVLSFPPQLYTYGVTFSTAGTFEYICLIHPDMKGTVNVT